ncbi:MAG TPA: isochorismatase family protein, partial [Edaphobacter sp.]|nr:isochorismatase family protein [Edaphobacter sp.]
ARSLRPRHTGADFHPGLDLPHAEMIVRKGFRRHIDSYSAFLEDDHTTPTGLAGYLRERGLKRLFLCGLAYDFCVRYSAIDGAAAGFECIVIEDATRAVALSGSVEDTNTTFADKGIQQISAISIL